MIIVVIVTFPATPTMFNSVLLLQAVLLAKHLQKHGHFLLFLVAPHSNFLMFLSDIALVCGRGVCVYVCTYTCTHVCI